MTATPGAAAPPGSEGPAPQGGEAAAPQGPDRRVLIRDIGVNAVLPYATYLGLTAWGVATVPALVAGAVFPTGAILFGAIRERRVQAIGIIVLTATAASVASALWFTSPFLALARGALMTTLIALVFLGSLAARRPLVFHLANAGQDAATRQEVEAEWDADPLYRRLMRRLTAIWGAALLVEAALSLVLIALLPVAVVMPLNEVLFWVFFGVLTAWSWRYGRRLMGEDGA
ncbi:MAG: hypothetical protein P4L71_01125 [Acetobacteraceae bacterium]|nr:hypothetical protein [Acetobacteraceae bacterium]